MCLTDLANPQYISGERTGIRTPDTRLRRALLYPAELCTHIFMERVKGIEPSQPAWKAGTLPLSYTRIFFLVEDGGFEPPKASLTDLQSAPFGRSGNPPSIWSW